MSSAVSRGHPLRRSPITFQPITQVDSSIFLIIRIQHCGYCVTIVCSARITLAELRVSYVGRKTQQTHARNQGPTTKLAFDWLKQEHKGRMLNLCERTGRARNTICSLYFGFRYFCFWFHESCPVHVIILDRYIELTSLMQVKAVEVSTRTMAPSDELIETDLS